ncbi:MAG: substrate-binding domain-containing protein, partial [Lentisphaeria bacterium]
MLTGLCAGLVGPMAVNRAEARDQIRIVGSSTVYPFASYVAEEFGATTKYPTPVMESTGSGGGIKLFSEGVGMNTPDISNASRRMKVSEFKRCKENGVENITEAVIGYDGIAVAHNVRNNPLDLTLEQITLAVAAKVPQDGKLVKNPYTYWDQVDKNLPHRRIIIFGPPTSSGTRDAFEELVMEAASKKMEGYGGEYTKIRQDGVYIPAGENDNLIVQKLARNKAAFGVFGYSFLAENPDKIQGASINGVKPEPESISSGKYPIARSLFFYI